MSLQSRIAKLEVIYSQAIQSPETDEEKRNKEHWERWDQAFSEIAGTMQADHLSFVVGELEQHFASDDLAASRAALSLLSRVVDSLASRVAFGHHLRLAMPPELAEIWNAHEKAGGSEHDIEECADCGAEYPATQERRHFLTVVRPAKRFTSSCVLCGGAVGYMYFSTPARRECYQRSAA